MTRTDIETYLLEIEYKLLFESEKIPVELTSEWTKRFSEKAGVYIFREEDEICYVGETNSIKRRMAKIQNTPNHTIRRNIGRSNFSKHIDYVKTKTNKKFPPTIEDLINELIESKLTVSVLPLSLGRKEFEERLCEKFQPKYNQQGNKGKAYTKVEKQLIYKQAYEPWTNEADQRLELLFCEGKSVKELSKIFERDIGAIRSRIKKLELKEKYDN